MSNLSLTLIIIFVLLVIVSNIILVKKSAKFGLKNQDGSPASSHDDKHKRKDNNDAWDDKDE